MRFITLVLLLVLSVILLVQATDKPHHYDVDDAQALFDQYVKDFKKTYKDDRDRETHFKQFKKKLQVVNDLNDKNYPQISFGINQFSDLSEDEMKIMHGFNAHKRKSTGM
ncbi:fruit bromelain-like [Hyposmocoma kahamanoa]|uniref:fruit bromelain-like n=1 Tax=Hyposmocoma kahamanoa TaxID=1477025 RepID=UPI000E6D9183|nr:fruit bromelain-like [Hyposmocoma kahamanoa]